MQFEDALPNAEYLIKSIAEQGYSLETALADLIDNSISASADKVEIIINPSVDPFTLYLADNGTGMSETELRQNMLFPSRSPDDTRLSNDLGRFGLGLKTASFSQTRFLTVISRKDGDKLYSGRSWNVNSLKAENWKIVIESQEEINHLLCGYKKLSREFLNQFNDFSPKTLVIWRGLYKFENYLSQETRTSELKKQLTEVTSEYLSLVFHRFLERNKSPLQIRINNSIIKPFNPFPAGQPDFRPLESNRKQFQQDSLKIEGYVLPSRSLDESKDESSIWTQKNKSLMDMEGLYIYRADRIILSGGWNGIIKKSARHQLARLKVDIGNSVDRFFHLNVAKSSLIIPYELRMAFLRYINDLRKQAEREYFNRGIRKIAVARSESIDTLFVRIPGSKGTLLHINNDFPLLRELNDQLNNDQQRRLRLIIRMLNTTLSKIRQVHDDKSFNSILEDGLAVRDVVAAINTLQSNGLSSGQIRESFLPAMGLRTDTLPQEIADLLK